MHLRFATQDTNDLPKRRHEVVGQSRVLALILGGETPGRFLETLRDIQRAEHPVPDARNQSQVSVPVFLQVAVVGVMHPGALQPVLEPARITK